MGGYAASTFADTLGLNRLVLFNPISTLNRNLVPWETRFVTARNSFDWLSKYADTKYNGHIIYDPLFRLDKLHAKRYSLREIILCGGGHRIPVHLAKIGILKEVEHIKDTIIGF